MHHLLNVGSISILHILERPIILPLEFLYLSSLKEIIFLQKFLKIAAFETHFSLKALCHESAMCSGNRYCLVSCSNVGLLDFRHVKKNIQTTWQKTTLTKNRTNYVWQPYPLGQSYYYYYIVKDSHSWEEKSNTFSYVLF